MDQQIQQLDKAKRQVEQRYRGLYQEHSKFEALRHRVEQRKDSHEKRTEQRQQDLLNVQRFSRVDRPSRPLAQICHVRNTDDYKDK
ncbi:MAG: hypothetical protein CM15mP120_08350 [Pseudomonadota bacterium]|nr:MAG: hypothetical protein CM15mP120_08350 [Pseudomonadota bacterium]